jgi:DNA-directed RNA polymerase subunit F
MFGKKAHALNEPIEQILEEMRQFSPETPEYREAVNHLERLMKLKNESSRRVSPDMMALLIGNFAITMAVLKYERFDVITTKAQNFLLRK